MSEVSSSLDPGRGTEGKLVSEGVTVCKWGGGVTSPPTPLPLLVQDEVESTQLCVTLETTHLALGNEEGRGILLKKLPL